MHKVAHGRNGHDRHDGKVARVDAARRENEHLVAQIGHFVCVGALDHVPVVAYLFGDSNDATEKTLRAVLDDELVLWQNGLA